MSQMYFDQLDYDVRCEWGLEGIGALAASCDLLIIVDVLSFSTGVDVAVGRGASVYPFRWDPEEAEERALELGAEIARSRRHANGGYSLSPASLVAIPAGTRIVMPSPNGSTLSAATGSTATIAGCLRNARAVAEAANEIGGRIGVIPAGERWDDGSLRPAIEDLLGAGAIISHLCGSRSPEAELVAAAFQHARVDILAYLTNCGSGRELIGKGYGEDVRLAAELDRSECVPILRDGAYSQRG